MHGSASCCCHGSYIITCLWPIGSHRWKTGEAQFPSKVVSCLLNHPRKTLVTVLGGVQHMAQTGAFGIPFSVTPRTVLRQAWEPAAPDKRPVNIDLAGRMRRRAESVQRLEAFLDIPMADCLAIVTSAQDRHYNRSFNVFLEDEPFDGVVLLLSGCLKITQRGSYEQDIILRLNGPGELLGSVVERNLTRTSVSARAVQPTTALVWQTSAFRAALERFPLLRRNVSHGIERQLDELDIRFREISTEKVASRLSSLLVRLIKQVGRGEEGQMEIALSRQELAQLTGTTLFTVSRLLCRWETQGILSARRENVLIHDVAALLEFSQQE
jgi:CRP/FNR family transcriptional regulator, nitrogen oxide reductase regulator